MRPIQLTDADTRALDELNGAEILQLRRLRHVYDRVVKEQQAEIETLRAEVDALKQQLTAPGDDVTPLVPDPSAQTITAIRAKRNGHAPVEAIVGGDG